MALGLPLQHAPASICVLRLSAIGDVCHALAAVQAIQRYWPQTRITWVVGMAEYQLLKGVAGIELVAYDKKRGFSAWLALFKRFRGQRFELLLNMQVAARASLVSLAIPARLRLGFDRARAKEGQWLVCNRHIAAQSQPHVLDGFAEFVRTLGVPFEQPHWQLPLGSVERDWAASQVQGDAPLLVLCPSASKAQRNWTLSGYVALLEHAIQRGFQIVLCAGPDRAGQQLAEQIKAGVAGTVIDLTGQTSLKQLWALLERAALVVAPDTGPAHMAVAAGTPVLGLYAHSNPHRTGPYLYQDYVVSAYAQHLQQQYGRSEAELPWGTRAKGDDLMAALTVEQVLAGFDRICRDHGLAD